MTTVLCRLCSSVCDWKLIGYERNCLLHKQNKSCGKCTLNAHIYATCRHRCVLKLHTQSCTGWMSYCYNSAVISEFSNFRKRFISPEGESINLPLVLAVCCHKIDSLSSPPTPQSGRIGLRQAWLTTASPTQPLVLKSHILSSHPHAHPEARGLFVHVNFFALAHRAVQESVFKAAMLINGCFRLISLLMFKFLLFQMNPMTNSH